MWRLVLEGTATLQELETTWSLDDVVRANVMLDIKGTVEDLVMKGIPKK